jgi:hypothetical protein
MGYSQLVANQVQKEYDCNNDKMTGYLAEVRRMEKFFDGFEMRYVLCLDNRDADNLAWIASSRAPSLSNVIIEKLCKPSVRPAEEDCQFFQKQTMKHAPTLRPIDLSWPFVKVHLGLHVGFGRLMTDN